MMPARKNNWLPGIFNDFFGNEWLERQNSTAPAVNILENEKEYKVEIAAPGMTREDFKIELQDDNHLIVSMEKSTEKKYEGDDQADVTEEGNPEENKSAENTAGQHKYLRREFSYSSFRQSMILPDDVNKEGISAKVNDGVLTIDIPKTTEEEKAKLARRIEVK